MVEISTADVFFQHERARYLSWFIFALYAGSDLGPVACGYIVDAIKWRWCFYISVIIFSIVMVIVLFLLEDTTFRREDQNLSTNKQKLDDEDGTSIDYTIPLRNRRQRLGFIETEYGDRRPWVDISVRPFYVVGFPNWLALFMVLK